MANKILKALSKNLGFKILAVIFAFTLWLTVYNLEDPTKSKTLTVNVSITNKDAVEEMGKYFEVLDGTNRVTFTVTAARSVLDKLDETDFVATANMEQMAVESSGETGSVPIEVVCTANVGNNPVTLRSGGKEMKVLLEDLMTKQFVVTPKAIGKVAEGYALGDVTVTAPNVLTVAGPKSIVQNVTSAVAMVDVDGISDSWATYRVTPTLYNADGDEVDTTRLTLSSTTVNVAAEILNTKEVTISVQPAGTPAEGYILTGFSSSPMKIQLKGDKRILNALNTITIPSNLISIEGASEDVKVTIDVSEYIPDGVSLLNSEESTIEITANIGKIKSKVFSVETKNIIVTGLSTHWELEFAHSSVAVTISGLEEEVNALMGEVLYGSIDVTSLPIGMHMVDLVLDLDETKYSYMSNKVMITISDPNAIVPEPPVSELPEDNIE